MLDQGGALLANGKNHADLSLHEYEPQGSLVNTSAVLDVPPTIVGPDQRVSLRQRQYELILQDEQTPADFAAQLEETCRRNEILFYILQILRLYEKSNLKGTLLEVEAPGWAAEETEAATERASADFKDFSEGFGALRRLTEAAQKRKKRPFNVNGSAAAKRKENKAMTFAVLGPYFTGKMLSKGSVGKVSIGLHQVSSRLVAIKTVDKARLLDTSPEAQRRLQEEIEIWRSIKGHNNIISLHEVLEFPSMIIFAMDYASNGELLTYLRERGRLPEQEARNLYEQVCDGVRHMHDSNIVHRDLKPENMLRDQDGRIQIADFGVATFIRDGLGQTRLLDDLCGTPSYMAPEVMCRQFYEGPPVDIWSLGVVLFAMLCGTLPFKGTDLKNLHENIVNSTDKMKLPQHLSPEAQELLTVMLCVDAASRVSLEGVTSSNWMRNSGNPQGLARGPGRHAWLRAGAGAGGGAGGGAGVTAASNPRGRYIWRSGSARLMPNADSVDRGRVMRSMSQSQASLEGPGLLSTTCSLRSEGGIIFPINQQGLRVPFSGPFGVGFGGVTSSAPGVPPSPGNVGRSPEGRAPPTPPVPPPPAPSPSHRSLDWSVPEEPAGMSDHHGAQGELHSYTGLSGPLGEMAAVPEHQHQHQGHSSLSGFVPSTVMSSAPPPQVMQAGRFLRGPSPAPGGPPASTVSGAHPPSPALRPRTDGGPNSGLGVISPEQQRVVNQSTTRTVGPFSTPSRQPPPPGQPGPPLGVAYGMHRAPQPGTRVTTQFLTQPAPAGTPKAGPPPQVHSTVGHPGQAVTATTTTQAPPPVYAHGAHVHCGLVTPRLYSGT